MPSESTKRSAATRTDRVTDRHPVSTAFHRLEDSLYCRLERTLPQLSSLPSWDILGTVTKRLIDVDDEKLEAVRLLLGTATLKATVDEAFDEVLALAERRRALLAERSGDASLLADPDARRAAWG